MENLLKTPPKAPVLQSPTTESECKTPPPIQPSTNENDQNSLNELRKSLTPDRLRVPKAFKYPERYTSPTDMMVSPVTKGLLARGRKGGALLPPGRNQPKIPDLLAQEASQFQNNVPMVIDEKLNKN
ncbi:hypothetical protein L6164_006715 [Bauhinia variegata]|uniref:Uncharacterized protein n=1 Tax=Bauhinia variegata TaxID=167791 RepID=A0ACB9PUR6_BAUVA|nr:hypothetical protein L6164_006715 [Bauhinia variegata]